VAIPRTSFARLFNDAATQSLTVPDTTQVLWSRAGAGPELAWATFEKSTSASGPWTTVGNGTRVGTTPNCQLTGLSLPTTDYLRARGRTAGCYQDGSSGLIEQIATYSGANSAPTIAASTLSRQQGTTAAN